MQGYDWFKQGSTPLCASHCRLHVLRTNNQSNGAIRQINNLIEMIEMEQR